MDPGLIGKMRAGEETAYREVVDLHERGLFNFILRYVGDRVAAEDLVQDTFVRMLRAIESYRPEASFKTWLYTIARNLCLDHHKYRRRHPAASLDAAAGDADGEGRILYFSEVLRAGGPDPSERAAEAESLVLLRQAVRRLDPLKREALLLRVYHGMSYEEAGAVAGSPTGTMKFRVHEAVRELGEMLSEAKGESKQNVGGE